MLQCWAVILMTLPAAAALPGVDDVLSRPERRASLMACFNRYTVKHPPRASSREEWEQRKAELRRQVLDCLGLWPLPERVPLNPRVAAERPGDGYVLQRIYWQVLAGVEASGWLYVPEGAAGRRPAVLCPHGHWDTGARHRTVQTRCIVLAKKGYVVLAVDSVHLDDYRVGVNPVGLMTWNNIRAIDLLVSREDVDPERIGCTGASGGGQQTMYLMAVEPRIAAAAPTVMISYFSRIVAFDVAHCYCNHVPAILRVTDEPQMCAAFAPKPALYMCDTRDWTQWFPHEGFPEIVAIYALYGAEDRVQCRQWDVGHDYTQAMREQMYAFFDRWLKRQPHPIEPEPRVTTVDPAELARMGPASPTSADMPAITADFMTRRAVPPLDDWSREAVQALRTRLIPALRDLLGEELAGAVGGFEDRGETVAEGIRLRRVVFESEPGVRVPAVIAEPAVSPGGLRAVVLAAPGGKAHALTEHGELVRALVGMGCAVMCPDYRLAGELSARDDVWLLHGILWGRPVAAMTARDLSAAATTLSALPEVAGTGVALVALGSTGVPAIIAAALDGGEAIAALACQEVGPTYRSGTLAFPEGDTAEIRKRRSRPAALAAALPPVIPNILKIADLPELAACILPRPLLLAGVEEEQPYAGISSLGARVQGRPATANELVSWLSQID